MRTEATICQVLHSLTIGGAEVLAAGLARRLGHRYRFVFACLDDLGLLGRQLCDEGFTVEVLGRRPGIDLGCTWRLARFWNRQKVDLIHTHQYTPFFYAMTARRWHRRPAVIFTEHGRWFPDCPRRRRILFNRLVLRRTDRVLGVGESVRRALIDNEGFPAARVEKIYNGVDLSAFNGRPINRSSIRTEIGLGADDLMIVQVARLDHLKDHCTAIRTIERVARRCENARLVLVGEGPQLEGIRSEINRRQVERYVRLLGLRSDVPRLLKAADVLLLSSISEGIPVTVVEAMAAGLPVVSTDVGGVAEIVQDGQTGLLASSGDDAALAEAILHLADNPTLRRQMGELGRRRAAEVFSQKQMHAEYERRYDQMLAGRAEGDGR